MYLMSQLFSLCTWTQVCILRVNCSVYVLGPKYVSYESIVLFMYLDPSMFLMSQLFSYVLGPKYVSYESIVLFMYLDPSMYLTSQLFSLCSWTQVCIL